MNSQKEEPRREKLAFAMLAKLNNGGRLHPMAKTRSGLSESDSAISFPGATPQYPLSVYLRGILPSLNPTERQIGEYVLAIPDVRRASGASVGSIVGFWRTLGVDGFASFKVSLARELAPGVFSARPNVIEGRPPGSRYESVSQFRAQSLRESLQLNTEATFEEVSRTIELARRPEFFSIGMSDPVAYTACNKLRLIGIPATTQSDSHLQLIAATQLQKGNIAFGISCFGSTYETVRCL